MQKSGKTEYVKDFDSWNLVKKDINGKMSKMKFRPGEIFWSNIGVNVASEIDGKGQGFKRPVLILGVFKQNLLFVLPITSGKKDGKWHFHYDLKDREVSICLHQSKTISRNRIGERVEKITGEKLKEIKKAFADFYTLI